jgi:hypothetical protein
MIIQVMHIKFTPFQFKYIGRTSVLPDYNRGYGNYLTRNIKHSHINNQNIKAHYSEYWHELYHEHVIVRMLLDFPNVGTQLWPTVSQKETTFCSNALFWAIVQSVVAKNPDSCRNLGPTSCPETSVRNYH